LTKQLCFVKFDFKGGILPPNNYGGLKMNKFESILKFCESTEDASLSALALHFLQFHHKMDERLRDDTMCHILHLLQRFVTEMESSNYDAMCEKYPNEYFNE
jgi:hypothetical protein